MRQSPTLSTKIVLSISRVVQPRACRRFPQSSHDTGMDPITLPKPPFSDFCSLGSSGIRGSKRHLHHLWMARQFRRPWFRRRRRTLEGIPPSARHSGQAPTALETAQHTKIGRKWIVGGCIMIFAMKFLFLISHQKRSTI